MNILFFAIILIILLLLVNPNSLKNFSHTMLGRLIFVFLIVVASCYKTYLGILLVLCLVILNQDQILEGMCSPRNCEACGSSLDSSKPNCNSYINDCIVVNGECQDKKKPPNSVLDQQNAQSFRETNCMGSSLYKDSDNTNVSVDDVTNLFPNVKFTGEKCNPCDVNCQFIVTNGNEQLTIEENMKPISSKNFRSGYRSQNSTNGEEPKPVTSLNKSSKNSTPAKTPIN